MTLRLALMLGVTAALLAGAWAAVSWSRTTARRVVAFIPHPRGLRADVPVVYAGVNVGRVERVECRDTLAVATLALYAADLELTRAHRARQQPVSGGGVELVAVDASRVALGASDTIAGLPPAIVPIASLLVIGPTQSGSDAGCGANVTVR